MTASDFTSYDIIGHWQDRRQRQNTTSSNDMTWNDITAHNTTRRKKPQWLTSQPATSLQSTSNHKHIASKHMTSQPWNGKKPSSHQTMVWASRWSVALRAFYRQILSLLYSSFFFWNFRPRLARELLVYICVNICIYIYIFITYMYRHDKYAESGPWITQWPFWMEKLAWITAFILRGDDPQEPEGNENLFPRFMNNPFRVAGLKFWGERRCHCNSWWGENCGVKRFTPPIYPLGFQGETSSKPPIFFGFKIFVPSQRWFNSLSWRINYSWIGFSSTRLYFSINYSWIG